jgi:hypothetical protein
MIVKELDLTPFELTDVWGFNWLNKLYVEFKISAKIKEWSSYAFIGFLKDIFEVKRDEIQLIEVSKDKNNIFLIFTIENTCLVESSSNLQVDAYDYVEVPTYEPIH